MDSNLLEIIKRLTEEIAELRRRVEKLEAQERP
jgi:hypothetical protein